MAYVPHLRLTFSGIFGSTINPVETWDFGVAMVHPNNVASIASELYTELHMDSVEAAASALITHADTRLSQSTQLVRIKCALVGADGRTPRDGSGAFIQRIREVSPAVAGGSAALMHPYQVAYATTLDTPRAGRNGRGRFYLPGPTHSIDSFTGTVSDAQRDATLARLKVFVDALNNVDFPHNVGVASIAGVNTEVTQLRLGRVLDTIRSRRRALVEDYNALPIVPS